MAATLMTLMLVYFLAKSAAEPQMSLLYGGLDQKNAGEVLAALEQLGVATDVRGDAVFVAAGERDRVRLELARQGLPQQGAAGYELLDELSGFGTTSEMFQAAYWRAKEGELARTILSVPGVRSARVHIGAASRRPFSRSSEKSTAAVTVRMAGGRLSEPAALSIRYLVALAVADLAPEQVAVIDAQNGVVLKPGDASLATMGDEAAERRARQLEQELERLLAVRVGDGAVRISVTVETSRESRKTSEHLVDPDSQVTLRAATSEIASQNSDPGQPVTVASNLPDGAGAGGGAAGKSDRKESTESVEYQYSVTTRDEVVEPGAVKRLGVAVLVDEARVVANDGSVTFEPRSAEEMAAIEELVKSAVAFDAERGDTVTISSMRFAPTPQPGEEVQIGAIERLLTEHMMTLIQLGLLGLVALALGLFVVRPILLSASPAAAAPALAGGVAAETAAAAALAASVAGDMAASGAAAAKIEAQAAAPAIESAASAEAEARLDLLRDAVGERPDEAVAVLQRWLTGSETGEPAVAA